MTPTKRKVLSFIKSVGQPGTVYQEIAHHMGWGKRSPQAAGRVASGYCSKLMQEEMVYIDHFTIRGTAVRITGKGVVALAKEQE